MPPKTQILRCLNSASQNLSFVAWWMLHITREHILNPKVDTPLFATNANPLQLSQGKNLAFKGTHFSLFWDSPMFMGDSAYWPAASPRDSHHRKPSNITDLFTNFHSQCCNFIKITRHRFLPSTIFTDHFRAIFCTPECTCTLVRLPNLVSMTEFHSHFMPHLGDGACFQSGILGLHLQEITS